MSEEVHVDEEVEVLFCLTSKRQEFTFPSGCSGAYPGFADGGFRSSRDENL